LLLAGEQNAAQLYQEGITDPTRASKMNFAWKVTLENLGIISFTDKKALSFL
jgi:hypothetical protein